MINLMLASEPADLGWSGWATVGGCGPSDPVGVVEWCHPRLGLTRHLEGPDYVLLHHREGHHGPERWSRTRERMVEHYSLIPGSTWWGGDLRGSGGCYRFRAYHRGSFCVEIRLRAPGKHHILPALAAVALGDRIGLPACTIAQRLEDFPGIARDFERPGTFRGVTLIDDEAGGRGGVGEALALAREFAGARTVRAVLLVDTPKLPSREEFVGTDQLYLVARGELAAESTRQLAAGLRSSGTSVVCCTSPDMAARELDRSLEPGDVLITLGNREVRTIIDAFLRRLCRHPHDRRAARPVDLVSLGRAGGLSRPSA